MPYRKAWEEPELFVEYCGVKVYRMYVNDLVCNPMTYTFTTTKDSNSRSFDVRDLPWPERVHAIEDDQCKKCVITEAISKGLVPV